MSATKTDDGTSTKTNPKKGQIWRANGGTGQARIVSAGRVNVKYLTRDGSRGRFGGKIVTTPRSSFEISYTLNG